MEKNPYPNLLNHNNRYKIILLITTANDKINTAGNIPAQKKNNRLTQARYNNYRYFSCCLPRDRNNDNTRDSRA